jgi:hypothetical protein
LFTHKSVFTILETIKLDEKSNDIYLQDVSLY